MDITELLQPMVQDGIRSTNFFNGRVLTAEDLRTEQVANRDARRQLGRALGEGVAFGLEAIPRAPLDGVPAIRVRRGLGFNRDGDPVQLTRTVDVRLVPRGHDVSADAGLFAICAPPQHVPDLANIGLYVLLARPASALSTERAPMTDMGSSGVGGSCGSRWARAGAAFSVAPLPLAPAGSTPTPLAAYAAALAADVEEDLELRRRGGSAFPAAVALRLAGRLSRLRNAAAYLCFGTDGTGAALSQPLPPPDSMAPPAVRNAIDAMRVRDELDACDLPLAVFYLSRSGVEWVDAWAVRRPLAPTVAAGELALLPTTRHGGDAVARILQFQAQLGGLQASGLSSTQLNQASAADFFRYLPPVGLLPVQAPGRPHAFTVAAFLNAVPASGQDRRLAVGTAAQVPGERMRTVAAEAMAGEPLDLHTAGSVELFRVQENLATPGSTPAPYVVFVNRDAQRPRGMDAVTAVMQDAWTAYRGLLRRQLFIPTDSNAATNAARVTVPAAVRGVMDMALQHATLASARCLPRAAALQGFASLRNLQMELVQLLETGMQGVSNPHDRVEFAARLRSLITGSPASSAGAALLGDQAGLGPSVEHGSIAGAIRAQQSINHVAATWQGGGDMEITRMQPESEQAIGQVLVIHGRNFAFPPSGNRLFFDDVEVSALDGFAWRPASNDARLEFVIPNIEGALEPGPVTVRVVAPDRSADFPYNLLPAAEVQGDPPVITGVTRPNNSPNLEVGQPAVVRGSGFAASTRENRVALIHRASETRFDIEAGTIDTAGGPTEFRFPVPTISLIQPGDSQEFRLEVTVGEHPPATFNVPIFA